MHAEHDTITSCNMVTSSLTAEMTGTYIIRRWRANDVALLPNDESYDEEEMYRRLNLLRSKGDKYVREQPTTARLIQP